jgi:hypothetical protein
MPDAIALRAVFGQDEANHGTTRYGVGIDGLVNVPLEAAVYLIRNGGFAVAEYTKARQARRQSCDRPTAAVVGLHHDTAGACSYARVQYRVDGNGDTLVPAEAVADLMAHGFVSTPPPEGVARQ